MNKDLLYNIIKKNVIETDRSLKEISRVTHLWQIRLNYKIELERDFE